MKIKLLLPAVFVLYFVSAGCAIVPFNEEGKEKTFLANFGEEPLFMSEWYEGHASPLGSPTTVLNVTTDKAIYLFTEHPKNADTASWQLEDISSDRLRLLRYEDLSRVTFRERNEGIRDFLVLTDKSGNSTGLWFSAGSTKVGNEWKFWTSVEPKKEYVKFVEMKIAEQ